MHFLIDKGPQGLLRQATLIFGSIPHARRKHDEFHAFDNIQYGHDTVIDDRRNPQDALRLDRRCAECEQQEDRSKKARESYTARCARATGHQLPVGSKKRIHASKPVKKPRPDS